MARLSALAVLAAVLLLATSASARHVLQAADPPNPRNGGPNVTVPSAVVPPAGNTVRNNWRGVGTQNYTASSTSAYVAGGAVAQLYLQNGTLVGRHYFITNSQGGISPVFARVEAGSGRVLGTVVGRAIANATTPNFNDDGGYSSIPSVLLQAVSADGFFAGITYIQRTNSLGGTVPGRPPLYALPAAFGGSVPNFQLAVPYQADYLFFTSGAPGGAPPASG